MPIDFACDVCEKSFTVSDEMAGRNGRCSACGSIMTVPAAVTYDLTPEPEPPTRVAPKVTVVEALSHPVLDLEPLKGGPSQLATIRAVIGISVSFLVLGGVTFGLYSVLSSESSPKSPRAAIAKRNPAPIASTPVVSVTPIVPVTTKKAPARPIPVPPTQPIVVATPTPAVPVGPAAPSPTSASTKAPLSVEEIVSRCEASVAVVRGPKSSGTGFLASPGLLVTNAHVVRSIPARSIRVHFPSAPKADRGPIDARVVHFDDDRDIAILAVESRLAPLNLDENHNFRRGQEVVFIGSPGLGGRMILENVASRGVLGSRVQLDDTDYYQLSGSVNGGNSGGPVIGMDGSVVAVVTARAAKEEGLGFCIPGPALVAAVRTALRRDPASQAEAAQKHEDTVRLATIRVRPSEGVDRGDDGFVADFLRKTEPATWLASFDANLILKDASPKVSPFRQSLRRADTIYVEDDRTIATMTIQFVTRVKEAGLPFSCATMLDCSQTWAPAGYLRGSASQSYLKFGETYCDLRINERLDHRATVVRMQATLTGQPAAVAAQGKAEAVPSGSAAKAIDRPAPAKTSTIAAKPLAKPLGSESPASKLEIAKRLEAQDNREAAIFAYENLIEKFPNTSQADESKKRLKKLKGE